MSAPAPRVGLLRFAATAAPRRRLVCAPFAGGGAAAFRLWTRSLPSDVEVVALQLPGRESALREPAFGSIAETVAAALPAVAGALDLPYAIFGHSMGALVAFELALALEAAGGPAPARLFVSGRRPPDEPDPELPVHGLPDEPFLDELQRRYNAVPEAVRQEPELLALLLPTLRADIRAVETYLATPGRRVRCPVHVYGGTEDRHPTPARLPGWQRVADRPVRVRTFPGDHFYLTAQRDALTAEIAASWAEAPVPAGRA